MFFSAKPVKLIVALFGRTHVMYNTTKLNCISPQTCAAKGHKEKKAFCKNAVHGTVGRVWWRLESSIIVSLYSI